MDLLSLFFFASRRGSRRFAILFDSVKSQSGIEVGQEGKDVRSDVDAGVSGTITSTVDALQRRVGWVMMAVVG